MVARTRVNRPKFLRPSAGSLRNSASAAPLLVGTALVRDRVNKLAALAQEVNSFAFVFPQLGVLF